MPAMSEAGTLAHGPEGTLIVAIDTEHYRIAPEDVRSLLFYGRAVPITRERAVKRPDGGVIGEVVIEGHAAVNRSGKAVMVHTRAGSYVIPLASFQRVARGEAVSAPLFPLVPGVNW
jgi:hypothetical protein